MNERFRLFVYGQLRRGEIGYRQLGLENRTEWLGAARVNGLIYDLGDYPGLVIGGEDIAHGELLGFDDPALWAILDDYEECDPDSSTSSEYRREEIELLDAVGCAWTYVYNRSVEQPRLIASGAWRRA